MMDKDLNVIFFMLMNSVFHNILKIMEDKIKAQCDKS